ncbi:hypothetical protein [Lichenicoccus sp.]|uniref:hypothetical protein n=1 Tax=Lichenicoccus sp. TaxID=2781899 RepID=UPI003D12C5E6
MATQTGTHIVSTTRQGRQLSERILGAAHQACEQGELDVAQRLLELAETVLSSDQTESTVARRHLMEGLVVTHQRLWNLRQPPTIP